MSNIPNLPKVQSHFSFTRDKYDPSEYNKYLQESQGAFKWLSQNIYENPDHCHVQQSPYMRGVAAHGINRNSIDVESELLNITRQAGKAPHLKYNPKRDIIKTPKYLNDCQNNSPLIPQYTRMDKPCNTFSGISINRFHPLCEDLQDYNKIHKNSYIGTNTRLQTRDSYAKKMGRTP